MDLIASARRLQLARGLLQIASTTIDDLAVLHVRTCTRFANRRHSGVGSIFKTNGLHDFIDNQRRQYQALLSAREDYLSSANKIIRAALERADDIWATRAKRPSIDVEREGAGTDKPHFSEAVLTPRSTFEQPTFVIYQDQASGHHFRLVSTDGTDLLTSEEYKSRRDATSGIEIVRKHATCEDSYERIETDSGLPMFNLKGGNHHVVATSLPHRSSSDMEHALTMVKSASANAPIAHR